MIDLDLSSVLLLLLLFVLQSNSVGGVSGEQESEDTGVSVAEVDERVLSGDRASEASVRSGSPL